MPFLPLILKTILLCAIAIMVRGTLPRYRFDHLINLTWKHFIFLWISSLVLNSFGLFILFIN